MTISSIEMVFYTCLFLVPGYFIDEIISSVMPNKQFSDGIKFLRFLSYSVINCAMWSWLYWLIGNNITSNNITYWVLIVAVTIISSVFTGTLLGILRKKDLFRKLLKFFGMQTEHPIPTAWDYKFSTTKDIKWVIVRLNNNEKVYGKYSTMSLASSDSNCHDIFLEEVYTHKGKYSWKMVDRSDGIWICADEIKSIEFFK